MKTIVVPVDFSAASENAVNFAILLAKKQNSKIILLHAFQMQVSVYADIPYDVLVAETEKRKEAAEKKLGYPGHKVRQAGVNFTYLIKEGSPSESIIQAINEQNADLVIMGTKDTNGVTRSVFGSTTTHVIEKADCPVIAVPVTADFSKPIRKITYATNYLQTDYEAIRKLMEIAEPLQATINILHVSTEKISPDEETKLMRGFINHLKEELNYRAITYQIMHGNDVKQQLEQHMDLGETDMLVMATRSRGLFERMFGRSFTRNLAFHTSVPLIAFHYKKSVPAILI